MRPPTFPRVVRLPRRLLLLGAVLLGLVPGFGSPARSAVIPADVLEISELNGGEQTVIAPWEGVDFGKVNVEGPGMTKTLTIKNTGSSMMSFVVVSTDKLRDPYFQQNWIPTDLEPGAQKEVQVTFKPLYPFAVTNTLTIALNDPGAGTRSVQLKGTGIDTIAPVIGPIADIGPILETRPGAAVVIYPYPAVSDNVMKGLHVGFSHVSGAEFPLGTTTVTVTARDAAGNTATATFKVTVVGAPRIGIAQAGGAHFQGNVVAWGVNTVGQAAAQEGLVDIQAIAAGEVHTLALCKDGRVVAWGYGEDGRTTVPAGLSGVVAITAGETFSVALKNDGTLVLFGSFGKGRLKIPEGTGGIKAIAASSSDLLALQEDGTVRAWGLLSGQGIPRPEGLGKVRAIAAGKDLMAVVREDGSVGIWSPGSSALLEVPADWTDIKALAIGGGFVVALRTDGTVSAWAQYAWGEYPVPAGLSGVTAIAAGGDAAAAIRADGSLVFWGRNKAGQFDAPAGLARVKAVALGRLHTVALTDRIPAVNFEDPLLGGHGEPRKFTLLNAGTAPLLVAGMVMSGPGAADFLLNGGGFPRTVPPRGSLTFSLTFKPTGPGPRTATLSILSNDPITPSFAIALSSDGTSPRPEDFAGTYSGLLRTADPSVDVLSRTGLLKISVQSQGAFTGSIIVGGSTFSLRGYFDEGGRARFGTNGAVALELSNDEPFKTRFLGALDLRLKAIGGVPRIVGALSRGGAVLAWIDNAARAIYTAKKNPELPLRNVPLAMLDPRTDMGEYTALFVAGAAPNLGVTAFPRGNGWAHMKVAASGAVRIVGKLADGSPVSFGNLLSGENQLPFLVVLPGKAGQVSGPIGFGPTSSGVLDARGVDWRWFRPLNDEDPAYPHGWPLGIRLEFVAGKYVKPAPGSALNALGVESAPAGNVNATLLISGGGLKAPIGNLLAVDSASRCVVAKAVPPYQGAANLRIAIAPGTGDVSGGFLYPGSGVATEFRGVVLQKAGRAAGYFRVVAPRLPGVPCGFSGSGAMRLEARGGHDW